MSTSERVVPQQFMHTFHLNYDSLVNIIKDSTSLNMLLNKLSMKIYVHPIMLSKNIFYEINNQFLLHFDEQRDLYLTIYDLVESDYYFYIKWKVTFPPFLEHLNNITKDHLFFTISIHNLGQDNSFIVFQCGYHLIKILNCLYNNNLKLKLETKVVHCYYKILSDYLKKNFRIKSQKESRFINVNFDTTKQYFQHTKICISMMGQVISYSDDLIKKGSVVVYRNVQKLKCIMQVRKFDLKPNSMHVRIYIYEGTKSSQPHRELKIELYAVNSNETLVILTHYFYTKVTQDIIDNLSLGKRKLLKKLSNIIEKAFKLR